MLLRATTHVYLIEIAQGSGSGTARLSQESNVAIAASRMSIIDISGRRKTASMLLRIVARTIVDPNIHRLQGYRGKRSLNRSLRV